MQIILAVTCINKNNNYIYCCVAKIFNKKEKNIHMKEENSKKPEFKEAEKENNNQLDTGENNNLEQDYSKKLKELEEKNKELNDKLLRTFAELENTRRRSKEEIEKSLKYGISKFAEDLIPIVENFYLAIDNAPKEKIEADEDIKTYSEGINLTQKELVKIFEKHGIQRIYPLNEKFDHNLHQAIVQIPSDEEEDTIIQVIQSGYKIGDRLLRPALVGVAKKQ